VIPDQLFQLLILRQMFYVMHNTTISLILKKMMNIKMITNR